MTSPAVGALTDPSALDIPIADQPGSHHQVPEQSPPSPHPNRTEEPLLPMNIGEGLPPLPPRLVKRIQSGQFIELSELLPDQLGIAAVDVDHRKPSKRSPKPALSIIEWAQGFGIYTAVLSKSGWQIYWDTRR